MIFQKKLLKISSIVLTMLVLLLIWLNAYDQKTHQEKTIEFHEITNINVSEIAAVAVSNNRSSYGLMVGENGILMESRRKKSEYSQAEMQAFIYSISKLVASRTVKNVQNLADYGLENPLSKITIIHRDGAKTRLFLGNQNPVDGRFYLMREGNSNIYLVDEVVGQLMLRDEIDFLSKILLPQISAENIDKIENIRISSKENPQNSFTISNQGGFSFKLTEPIYNTVGIDSAISQIIMPLTALQPDRLVENGADFKDFGLNDPIYTLEITLESIKYQIVISKSTENKYYIARVGDDSIFEIDAEKIAFLQVNYLDILDGYIYNNNLTTVSTLSVFDHVNSKDYYMEISGKGVDVFGVIENKEIAYSELMAFYSTINSIGIAKQIEKAEGVVFQQQKKPYLTIIIEKKSGLKDILEFYGAQTGTSYVSVNGVINFKTYNKSAIDILNGMKKIME